MSDSSFPNGWGTDRVGRVRFRHAVVCLALAGCATAPATPNQDLRLRSEAEVIAALHRFGSLLAAKDTAIIREFAPDADALLVGSESDEIASGPDEIARFFRAIMRQPLTIAFEWRETRASVLGDQGWVFAAGEAILRTNGTERRSPYRLTGVFQFRDGKWLWKHFHGSEPAHQ